MATLYCATCGKEVKPDIQYGYLCECADLDVQCITDEEPV